MSQLLIEPARRLRIAAIAMLALAAPFAPAAAQAPARNTIVVLPLANAGDAAQAFFAEGLTDEIAVALTAVPGLDVVARSSAFQLKPEIREPKTIGAALHARYLVQGTASLAAERVHLDVRLVQAAEGAQVWAEAFDVSLPGIFDAEEIIARKVAAALKLPL